MLAVLLSAQSQGAQEEEEKWDVNVPPGEPRTIPIDTRIEPIQSYAHSFVAMLSPDRDERITALARILVLDPKSRSVALADAAELAKAKEIAATGYPIPRSMVNSKT